MLVPHLLKIYFGSNDVILITIKIEKKIILFKITKKYQAKKVIQNKNLGCQMDIRETNSDYEMEKR